jgi:DNA helicase-2/ATP-dependent DNA helicase PcrA
MCVAGEGGAEEEGPSYLKGLNAEQQRAVVLSPLSSTQRVLAAPGSGKTRTLTCRVAHLIKSGVHPEQILCITFTRKAAHEMQKRISELVGPNAKGVKVGTFHSVAALLLHQHMHKVPGALQRPNFTIYDQEDAGSLMRSVLREMGVTATGKEAKKPQYKGAALLPKAFQRLVSRAKSALPRAYACTGGEAFAELVRVGAVSADYERAAQFKTAFDLYNAGLARANAVDFDDLLSFTVAALHASPELAAHLAHKWPHILVDEFQDTSLSQYDFVRCLAQGADAVSAADGIARSLLVVGDFDQSIYGWRGAEVEIMRRFVIIDMGADTAMLASTAARPRSAP